MDAKQRIEIGAAAVQAELEKHIGMNPDDLKAIDDLWRVQKFRYANAVRMTVAKENTYGSQDTR